MTHKYLYIEAGAQIDATTHFFIVWLGNSKQADRDYLYLVANATNHNHYFKLWSKEVDDFIVKVRESLHLNSLPFQSVTARALVRSFKSSTSVMMDAKMLHNSDYQRRFLDTNYRIITNLKRKC